MSSTVLQERRGKIGILTMNRPEKLNTLNDDLLISLYNGVKEMEEDEELRVIVVRAAGRSFCAGFDLSPREKPFTTVMDWHEHAKLGNRTFMALWECKKPTIAAVQGFALGGGCDLAMACDFTIAADNAVFGEPEIQFSSSTPLVQLPWMTGMKRAKQVLLTGDRIDAATAEQAGMVTSLAPAEALDDSVMALAQRLVKIPVPAMQMNKAAINQFYRLKGMCEALDEGARIFAAVHMTKTPENEQFFAVAAKEGLAAAFKWRDALFADEE